MDVNNDGDPRPVLSPARRRLLKGGLVALGLAYAKPVVEVIHPTPALAQSGKSKGPPWGPPPGPPHGPPPWAKK